MDEMIAIIITIWISFGLGAFIVFWLGRGFIGKYLKAFFTGRPLLRVHLDRGGFLFRVGENVPGGSVTKYSLWSKGDVRYVSLVPGAVLNAVRCKWVDVTEKDSAPFRWDLVQPVVKERDVKVKDENGKERVEREEYVDFVRFVGWNDSSIIRNMLRWALMRPKRKIAGGIDIRMILVGLVIVVIAVVVISQLSGGGDAANVI